jgi:hypothetical protein
LDITNSCHWTQSKEVYYLVNLIISTFNDELTLSAIVGFIENNANAVIVPIECPI